MRRPYVDFRELKAAVPIRRVIERYGLLESLRERGDSLSGPCPLCEGNTSFRVSLGRNCFHCFGCKAGGNMLDLVAAMEDCSVRDAAARVAEWFGVETSRPGKDRRGGTKPSARKADAEVIPEAKPGPAAQPVAGPADSGEKPVVSEVPSPEQAGELHRRQSVPLTFELKLDPDHPWLAEAGLSPETVREFGIGFCSRGMMSGRIAFPIRNARGELLGYAGRWPGDDPPEGETFWRYPKGLDLSAVVYPAEKLAATAVGEELLAGDPLMALLCRQRGIDAYFVPGGTGLAECIAAILRTRE